jgi:hypothetical protein
MMIARARRSRSWRSASATEVWCRTCSCFIGLLHYFILREEPENGEPELAAHLSLQLLHLCLDYQGNCFMGCDCHIEDAFLVTKRVLELAYLGKASAHGVQLQLYATFLFYLVLLNVGQQVAPSLNEPLERISVEMVFRAFYHYSRALTRGESTELLPYLVHHAKLLGLVKRQRKRHREILATEQEVWSSS